MIDVDELIRDELERLAPVAEAPRPAWDTIVAAAAPIRRTHGRRGRLALIAAAACVAVAAPAVAVSGGVRGLLGLKHPRPVAARASLVVSAPVGHGFFVHVWHAPSATGGRCSVTTAGHSLRPSRLLVLRGGGVCSFRGGREVDRATADRPLVVTLSIQRRPERGDRRRWAPPIVRGNVHRGLHAARVDIEWRGGSHRLVLADGYFLGGTEQLYVPPFEDFPFYVVVYDARGREVARKKLDSPTLRLMSHGWKQYAREYRAWKRSQRR